MKKTLIVGLVLIVLGSILGGIGYANGGMKSIVEKNGKIYFNVHKTKNEISYEFDSSK